MSTRTTHKVLDQHDWIVFSAEGICQGKPLSYEEQSNKED
jgi:hypothetical protein